MKAASGHPCPVCGGPTWEDRDLIDYGTVLEEIEWCDCGAWRYEYMYGSTEQFVGPDVISHHWTDSQDMADDFRHKVDAAIAIARRQDRALLAACREAPQDAAPRLILADWCDENDMPMWAEFWRQRATQVLDAVTSTSV